MKLVNKSGVDHKDIDLIYIGKKGFDFLKSRLQESNHIMDHVNLFSNLNFGNVAEVSQEMMDSFLSLKYDKIHVVYGQFKNAAVQDPVAKQWLPVEKIDHRSAEFKTMAKADYIFEPSKEELLEELVPSILQTSFHSYLLDTQASEHGARMTAMDKATENANEMLKELKINYNKARQESITNEILEIVGGAAALDA